MTLSLADWTRGRSLAAIGTNAGSTELPFQTWKPFKEAFAPELIEEAVRTSSIPVRTIFDPFSGSGTTGLAAQFLGVQPVLSEVNPYLADLTEAKLTRYDSARLLKIFEELMHNLWKQPRTNRGIDALPQTFVPPGRHNKYVYHTEAAECILAIRYAIDQLDDVRAAKLFRVLLGATLVEVSNVRISGKGRRYRSGWQTARPSWRDVLTHFSNHTMSAILDIANFGERPNKTFILHRGDSRTLTLAPNSVDLVVTSPPYPNSFDYTDVYNLELWMLGYLQDKEDNTRLRRKTLTSHVQLAPVQRLDNVDSPTLMHTVGLLEQARDTLWSRHLPVMIGNYFRDLQDILLNCRRALSSGGQCWFVIGDSRYADIYVNVAKILCELSAPLGFTLIEDRPFRSMRASPQQGGRQELEETLLVLSAG